MMDRPASNPAVEWKVVSPGEDPLVLHSTLAGPIAQLGFWQRSLLFAELAMISYNDVEEVRQAGRMIG
ncbi:MAG: lipase family protein, partial [Pirellulales bacterium]|nr:lipase family protein [Pirellulales bacterium]